MCLSHERRILKPEFSLYESQAMVNTLQKECHSQGLSDFEEEKSKDAAVFRLRMQKRKGEEFYLLYDPHSSKLFSVENKRRLIVQPHDFGHDFVPLHVWPDVPTVSPQTPLNKSLSPSILRIQLGRFDDCKPVGEAGVIGNLEDAKVFAENLPLWLSAESRSAGEQPFQVEFWGGEPFTQWPALEYLGSFLSKNYSPVEIKVITTGHVLDQNIITWLERLQILVVVRHDGPAQKFTLGADIFDEPVKAENLRQLYQRLHPTGKIRFCCRLSGYNHSLSAVKEYLAAHLGCRAMSIPLTTEEMLFSGSGKNCISASKAEINPTDLRHTLFFEISHGMAVHAQSIKEKLQDFYRSLAYERPSSSLGQFCHMDRADSLAVDLKGNALTCQAVSVEEGHAIGHVSDYANIRLNTAWHWSRREECPRCPVLQLCKGGCMKLEGGAWRQACDHRFAFHLALFAAGLYFLTGGVLKEIGGKVLRRPDLPGTLPVIQPDVLG